MLDGILKFTNVPGLYVLVCPHCNMARNPKPSEQDLIIQKKAYRVKTPCANCRNTSTLHQMLLQRRLLYDGIPPTPDVPTMVIPWNPFFPVTQTHNQEFRIGLTKTFQLDQHFKRIWEILPYAGCLNEKISVEGRFVPPDKIELISSTRDNELLGKEARITVLVFAGSPVEDSVIWKDLLGESIMLLRREAFKSSIVQCYAAFETFLESFVEEKLTRSPKPWQKGALRYLSGDSRDALPLAGLLQVIIDEVLEIRILDSQSFKDWIQEKSGCKALRNAIAHGNEEKFKNILKYKGTGGWSEKQAAEWVLRTIMILISDIRYWEPN